MQYPDRKSSQIIHPVYGQYTQTVYDDISQAGHKKLASGGKYGWGMPTDPPTDAFVKEATDKTILEIGSGLGDTVAVPALKNGARMVFATDVSAEHFSRDSFLQAEVQKIGLQDRLRTFVLDPNWWDKPLSLNPSVETTIGRIDLGELPTEGTVDAVMARHSLQFGHPDGFMQFLDLASSVLKNGGVATAINFTPYTEYMYQFDQGKTLEKIISLNKQFAEGRTDIPGGYLHREKGSIKASLAMLMRKDELDRNVNNSFLYYDDYTLIGLMNKWNESRAQRGLAQDLTIANFDFFTPSSIAKVNKLVSSPGFENKENFVFNLKKVAS